MLAFPVADEVERLQGADDVFGLDRGHVAHHADRQLALVVPQQVHQHVGPVAAAVCKSGVDCARLGQPDAPENRALKDRHEKTTGRGQQAAERMYHHEGFTACTQGLADEATKKQ